jgi:hypothetical protein
MARGNNWSNWPKIEQNRAQCMTVSGGQPKTEIPVWRGHALKTAVAVWLKRVLLLVAFGLLCAFANNNLAWWPTSRQTFLERLDRAAWLGRDWMLTSPEGGNTALLYMIADMAALSGDQRLGHIIATFLADPRIPPDDVWRRVVDPAANVRAPSPQQLDGLQDYQRWILYAVAGPDVRITESERANMFAPDRFMWGSRTHQLFSLILYRSRAEHSARVNDLVNHLCEKIAMEAQWDVRVTDLYLQRIAFILAAGRPDLIKRRWVERAIASQTASGGWMSSWYGWGPGLFAFSTSAEAPNSHTTVQGAWILYMLKYRYPDWIELNYQ